MLCHPERKRRISRMQMTGPHSGCLIYPLWRDPSPSARFKMTPALLSDLRWILQFSWQWEVLPSQAAPSELPQPSASFSLLPRPVWHLLRLPRPDECCDSRHSTWTARPSVAAAHRTVHAYLAQILCPS